MKKRTKALAISPSVRSLVAARDSIDGWPCCVLCGSPNARPEAHFIPRSQGGLGIEENIFTACRECHRDYDQTNKRTELKKELRMYFKEKYPDWDESKLIYRKEN